MKHVQRLALAAVTAVSLSGGSALAQSAFNWNSIKMKGEANPRPWCGQWWGYRCNGIATNNKNNRVSTMNCGYPEALSPAEKLDHAVGRQNLIEYAKLDNWLKCALAAWSTCHDMAGADRAKCLQDASKSNAYRACAQKPQNQFKVDTAYEYEIQNKGQGAYGWDSWWGQCNAWGAAAVLYAEPRRAVQPAQQTGPAFATGWRPQTFSVADIKGLLTSAMNDIDMAADGWFGCRYDGPAGTRTHEACKTVQHAYDDVTPRQLLAAFSKHIGTDHHGVVIDRHTDWEVWNQPLWKYAITNCRESRDPGLCGATAVKKTCNLSFTWAEDGVGHGEVCDPPYGYTERNLAFSVCVQAGNILGDRKNQRWEVPASVARSERWPDFIWVPSNLSATAQSGNPFVHKHFDQIVALAQLAAGDVVAPNPRQAKLLSATPNKAIPDNNAAGVSHAFSVTEAFPVRGVAVCVDIVHPNRSDLVVSLKGPNGETEVLWDRSAGAEDNIKDCHDATSAGLYGVSAKGTWTVQISDRGAGNLGKWQQVQLKLMH